MLAASRGKRHRGDQQAFVDLDRNLADLRRPYCALRATDNSAKNKPL